MFFFVNIFYRLPEGSGKGRPEKKRKAQQRGTPRVKALKFKDLFSVLFYRPIIYYIFGSLSLLVVGAKLRPN